MQVNRTIRVCPVEAVVLRTLGLAIQSRQPLYALIEALTLLLLLDTVHPATSLAQSYGRTYSFGSSSGNDTSTGVAYDSQGNKYIVGTFFGSVDFDPSGSTDIRTAPSSASDGFVSKFDSSGNHVWTASLNGVGTEQAKCVVVDTSDNIFVVGSFGTNALDFDPGPGVDSRTALGNEDIFIWKLTSNKTHVWARAFGVTTVDQAYACALDSSGNILAGGTFYNTIDLDASAGQSLWTSAGDRDVFVAKYSSAGDFLTGFSLGGNSIDYIFSITTDASNNIYIGGSFSNTVDFDPSIGNVSKTSNGGSDAYLAKYSSDGNILWARAFGRWGGDQVNGIAINASGNPIAVGGFNNTVNFDNTGGTDNKTSSGQSDIFIVSYNSDGTYGSTRTFGGTGDDAANTIFVKGNGAMLLAGHFANSVDFSGGSGTGNKTSQGLSDMFIANFQANNSLSWVTSYGSSSADKALYLAYDSTRGYVGIVGTFSGTVDFSPDPTCYHTSLTAPSTYTDAFFQELGPEIKVEGYIHKDGVGLSNVSVSGPPFCDVITDSGGNFTLPKIFPGRAYTLTPTLSHYNFMPTTVTVNTTTNTTVEIEADLDRFTLSGHARVGGVALENVSINGGIWGNTVTDSSGYYQIAGISYGSAIDVTPGIAGYSFNPTTVHLSITNDAEQDFSASLTKHTISGAVNFSSTPLAGVLIDAGMLGSTTTASDGTWQISNIDYGTNYSITAALIGYVFSPNPQTGQVTGNTNVAFSVDQARVDINGQVLVDSNPLNGVVVNGGSLGTVTTGADGRFAFPQVIYGTHYNITFAKNGYSFDSANLTGVLIDSLSLSVGASLVKHRISGRVLDGANRVDGVVVNAGALGTVTTGADGRFDFPQVPYGTHYNITFAKDGYSFDPANLTGVLIDSLSLSVGASLVKHRISGRVLDGANGVKGVVVNAGSLGDTVTNRLGEFRFDNALHGSSYVIRPAKAGYRFVPTMSKVTTTSDVALLFSGYAGKCTISGTVSWNKSTVSGVQVNGGKLGTVLTDSSGRFSFDCSTNGTDYFITASHPAFSITPSALSGTTLSSITLSFQASALDRDGDGLSDPEEIRIGTNPLAADTDNDGISDLQEEVSGSNPTDRGSFIPLVSAEKCAVWNKILAGSYNILELVNLRQRRSRVTTSLYGYDGQLLDIRRLTIQPDSQIDLILGINDLSAKQSMGQCCLEMADNTQDSIGGRVVYFNTEDENRISYSFPMEFGVGLRGEQATHYELSTFASLSPAKSVHTVHTINWIEISNYENKIVRGTAKFYDEQGSEVASFPVKVLAKGVVAVPVNSQPSSSGLLRWIPSDANSRTAVQSNSYYYEDNFSASANDGYNTTYLGQGLAATYGSGRPLIAPFDSKGGINNLRVSNTLSTTIAVHIIVYSQVGSVVDNRTFPLRPMATENIPLNDWVPNQSGSLLIKGSLPGSVFASLSSYVLRDVDINKQSAIQASGVYSIIPTESLGQYFRGSYNTFLDQRCQLLIVNATNKKQKAYLSMKRFDQKTVVSERVIGLGPNSLATLDLCSLDHTNAYGTVTLRARKANTISAWVLRTASDMRYRFATYLRPIQ